MFEIFTARLNYQEFFVQVEIPQHPVDLHSIVTRGTKELSSTLQEFRGVRILQRSNKISTVAEDQTDRGDWNAGRSSPKMSSMSQEQLLPKSPVEGSELIKPLVMQFHLVIYFSSPTKKLSATFLILV